MIKVMQNMMLETVVAMILIMLVTYRFVDGQIIQTRSNVNNEQFDQIQITESDTEEEFTVEE